MQCCAQARSMCHERIGAKPRLRAGSRATRSLLPFASDVRLTHRLGSMVACLICPSRPFPVAEQTSKASSATSCAIIPIFDPG